MGLINSGTAKAVGGSAFKSTFRIFKIGTLFLIFSIVFAKACIDSYQQKSVEPLIKEVGGKIALATKDLAVQSQLIIDKGNIYHDSLWSIITTYAELLFAVIAVISWIRIFTWIWARSPYSFPGNAFENFTVGTIVFLMLQIIFLLATAGFAHELNGWRDVGAVVLTPFKAFILLFKAIAILINPLSVQVEKYADISEPSQPA